MINTIHLWDCLEIMKRIPDGSIDAIITDPPYWSTACRWDSVIPFETMWEQLKRIIKPNGAIVLFWSEPFSSALRMSNIKQYKYDWIWDKVWVTNPMMAKKQPMRCNENISVFYREQCIYNPVMRVWKKWSRGGKKEHSTWTLWESIIFNKWSDISEMKYPRTIIEFSNADRTKNLHPTQKPVALIEYLIKTYTNEWETVLDFTAWSFTTAVASDNTNRKWICIEQDEWYCKIWAKRINENRLKLWLDILDFTSILEK